jgi:hypothetical protein
VRGNPAPGTSAQPRAICHNRRVASPSDIPVEPMSVDIQARFRWQADALADSVYVNAFATFAGLPVAGAPEDVVYVVLGRMGPPVIADEASLREFVESGSQIDVRTVASLAIPLERAREFRDQLNSAIDQADQAKQ